MQRATVLMRETACLTVPDRAASDREFCCDAEYLAGCGDHRCRRCCRAGLLMRDADSVLARRRDRTRARAQIMTDLLVERVTGIGRATPTPITVNLAISDQTLFGDATDPALPISWAGPESA